MEETTFFKEHILEIIFGIIAVCTSTIAVVYRIKAYNFSKEKKVNFPTRNLSLYLNRESMVNDLFKMYDKAEAGDELWIQTVSMSNYPGLVHEKILTAAGKNISFKIIVNKNAPSKDEFRQLFSPVKSAEILETADNKIRIQGLSKKEVIIAFPTILNYTAIRVTDENFVSIMKEWFDKRFEQIKILQNV